MYEESESERYRAKLKDDFNEFVRNQDVYNTLIKINKEVYSGIIEAALGAFACSAEELEMEHLKELEGYLKLAKSKYFAIVNHDEEQNNIEILDNEEEDPEPEVQHHTNDKSIELDWRMPRRIPVANSLKSNPVEAIPPVQQQHQNNFVHQNMSPHYPQIMNQQHPQIMPQQLPIMPQQRPQIIPQQQQYNIHPNPWQFYPPNYATASISNNNVPQQYLMNQGIQYQPVQHPASSSPRFIFNQSMFNLNTPQYPAITNHNPHMPSTSRQSNYQERHVATSYREHRLMKEQEHQKKRQEEQKKRQEEQIKRQKENEKKKKREHNEERELYKQKELEHNRDKAKEQISHFKIRQQQVEEYKKRESESPISSKESESSSKTKKSVTWADQSEKNSSNNASKSSSSIAVDKSTNKPSSNSSKVNKKGKDPNSERKALMVKELENFLKVNPPTSAKKSTSSIDKSLKVQQPSNNEKQVPSPSNSENSAVIPSSSKKSVQKSVEKPESSKKLRVFHPTIKIQKEPELLTKRKSINPVSDDQPKRQKEATNEENIVATTSNCDMNINTLDIKIKEEQLSDYDCDGNTENSASVDLNQPEKVQEIEINQNKIIKQEPELNLNDSVSTDRIDDIKEEVMSTIDQDNSSVHSEKMDDVTENFLKICDDPELLNTIAENVIDFSQFENLTEEIISNNNNNETQINSQDKCASWLERINSSDFTRTTESPQDAQFYLSKDEEEEPDDEIVPFYPVRNLGEAEIVPKEEEQ